MSESRTYKRAECVAFRKTDEPFGGLSNMASGYPLNVAGVTARTSEALYQACRFPHLPEVQRIILGERSPMTAKMRGKPHRADSRPDWDDLRVAIMRWCLRVKLTQHRGKFGALLHQTGDRDIVEDSRRDDFWGAVPSDDDEFLQGRNVLGRLLMELREILRERPESLEFILPPPIEQFTLLGRPLMAIGFEDEPILDNRARTRTASASAQLSLL